VKIKERLMLSRRRFLENFIVAAAALGASDFFSPFSVAQATDDTDIPVLLYHRVGEAAGPLTIAPDKFAEDLARLRKMGYETISLDTFHRNKVDPETPLPKKPIMISFDDGYLDNYLNAYPILQKYGMTAAFYIITSMVGAEDRLTGDNICAMSASGMSIGSHTVSHGELGNMGVEEAANEMSLSRMYLEGLLQKSVNYIAYPKGSYNASTGSVASETGYWGGFSIVPGTCSRATNPYVLKRIPVFSFDGDIGRTLSRRGRV
jgi:peptidoglycan/xylan/chitin deacetylase (PgdA/CDA1 family)